MDEILSIAWSVWLAQHGFESVHWSEIGKSDTEDAEIMSFALANQYVILTRDLDFGHRLLDRAASLRSVIQLRGGHIAPETVGMALLKAREGSQISLQSGAIPTVTVKRSRMTLLPLRGRS